MTERDTESTNIPSSMKMAIVIAMNPKGPISVATITPRSSGMKPLINRNRLNSSPLITIAKMMADIRTASSSESQMSFPLTLRIESAMTSAPAAPTAPAAEGG